MSKVLGDLANQLKGIQTHVIEKASREIAADVVGSNTFRIHNEGKAVDGSDIGSYSDGKYKTKRQEAGKRVDKIDLSFSGKLSKEFTFEANGDTVGVGFLTEYGEKVSEAVEDKYGKIWGMTEEDERVAEEITKNRLNDYLSGKRT